MKLFLTILLALPFWIFGQTPGNLVGTNNSNEYINFGEILKNARTISFWLKLQNSIGPNLTQEAPILVRDENDPTNFASGEFAIYFGKSGTNDAGHLVFSRATTASAFSVKSDTNAWQADVWFHVAAVIDPQAGMKLYINGVLQQATNTSTEKVYTRQEGNTGPVYFAKWGSIAGYSLLAKIDELRVYTGAVSESDLRSKMCMTESFTAPNISAYFDFDNATTGYIPSRVGAFGGAPNAFSTSNLSKSNAPVGDLSEYIYNFTSSDVISLSRQSVSCIVDSAISPAQGMHIYATQQILPPVPGIHNSFFGVWFTKTNAQYHAVLDYSQLNSPCDSCNEIKTRDFQTGSWKKRSEIAQNCQFDLPAESPGALNYREEYWLTYRRKITSGLDDVMTSCEGDPVHLIPTDYPGGTYLWNDGDTNRRRSVDTAGIFILQIKWQGCEVIDTVEVQYNITPKFKLPNDTAICVGDTLILEAPFIDSAATYSWGFGLSTGRRFRMYEEGTISLTITLGNCSWTDEITVDIIRSFPLYLGPDTTLCLGEEITLKVTPGLDYLWSNGEVDNRVTIFNQPQKVWVQAWNTCFTKTDTINIEYEECDCHFFMANSFTPNNDGVNDIFIPVTGCLYEEFEFEVYDRWGKRVFYTTKLNQGWDGTFNGKRLTQGVYTYQLRYKKYTQNKIGAFERGTINLIY